MTHERGGMGGPVRALAGHQAGFGHEVSVLTTDQGVRRGEHPVELPPAVTVVRAAVWGSDRIAYAPRFASLVRRHVRASDVVHLHSVFTYPVHAALREVQRASVPVVFQPHGMLHRYSLRHSPWRKRAYLALWGGRMRQACAAWHYSSENEAAESWPWEPRPHFILPYGIEAAEYALDREEARRVVRRLWPQVGDAPYVLFLGRLHPKKRPDLLIEAFLAGASRGFKLVVAGPDERGLWPGYAARLLRDSASARQVMRIGLVTGRAKAALLAGACLFALPSEHESFGIAPLEALASGTPVLLSPHVDLARLAIPSAFGYVAPLKVEAWGAMLASILGGGPVGPVEEVRQWVTRHFGWERITGELLERYRRLCRQ